MIAVIASKTTNNQIGILITLVPINNPEIKSKLSPGRKNPIRRPDSAKIIARTPGTPIQVMISFKSRPKNPMLSKLWVKVSSIMIIVYK